VFGKRINVFIPQIFSRKKENFSKVCYKALGIDNSIIFTGIVIDYGELIVGLP